jgi:CelD/BcsL family acetyltransferase involved in cellulose biosynthesis
MHAREGQAWRLGASLAACGWKTSTTPTDVCPYIDLRDLSWPGYLQRRGSSLRYNFRRRLRHLESLGPVTLACPSGDEERREWLRRMVDFHLERWNHRGGSDAFHRDDLVSFHERFSQLASSRGWLRLFALRVGERPVAFLYCFRYRGTLLFYQSGFDEECAKLSVGLVAMGLAIKQAIEEGADEYDMLHGSEAYKFHWADKTREIGRLELYPRRLLGSWCHKSAALTRAARRTVRQVLAGSPLINNVETVPQGQPRARA